MADLNVRVNPCLVVLFAALVAATFGVAVSNEPRGEHDNDLIFAHGGDDTLHGADNDDWIFASGTPGGGFLAGGSGKSEVSFPSSYSAKQIIVSLGDRRLYYITKKGEAISYPIGVPAGNAVWKGKVRVSRKAVNPPWTPTASMRRENPSLPAHVPGGHPRNPLGVRALYLGNTLYRIHGTDAPWTVGRNVTHGCIRLYNSDVVDLYQRVRVGTPVTVTSRRFGS